jgi:hypothetical protein
MKNSCVEQIRPTAIGRCIGLDRLATWDEARWAISQGTFEFGGLCDDFREADSDCSGRPRRFPEDNACLAIAYEMIDCISN